MDITTWNQITCPNCKKANWLCEGDLSDMTGFSHEDFECWNCHKCYDIESGEEVEEAYNIGMEKP